LVSHREVCRSKFELLLDLRMQEINMGAVIGLCDVVFDVASMPPLFVSHMM
jgi:hypothetical protein